MKRLRQLLRLSYINYILAKNGLDRILFSHKRFAPIRFVVYLNPWNWRKNPLSRGEALRRSLESLGPIFVKFGQALSTRPDLLPEDIVTELCKLQDKVPPFSSDKVLAILQEAYGMSPHSLFASFDEQPLASASISQVHAATLKTGEDVVVKVLRPDMEWVIAQDLGLLYTIAHWMLRYLPQSRRFRPKEVIQEFELTLKGELNLLQEAANAAKLRRNFLHSPLLYIPEVYWDYSKSNILVMERIHGIPVSNVQALQDLGIDMKHLAERGVEIFFQQVFRDCFFHADMHPGNIFVSYEHPENPKYLCIDFGIIGTLNDSDKRYLAENLLAFFNRDYRRVASLHVESGWVAKDTRVEEFETDIRTVCEPIFEKPLKDISFAQLVLRLFQVARRFQMEVQPQLILLQKTLFAIEGLGRQLYPELDLWRTAKPFLEKWVQSQVGPKAFFRQMQHNLPFFAEQLPHLPKLIFEVLTLQKAHLVSMETSKRSIGQEKKQVSRATLVLLLYLLSIGILAGLHLVQERELSLISLLGALVVGGILLFRKR